MNASLHPLFTPRIGRPSTVRASGTPAAARRSNAARASGGSSNQGAPGEPSSAIRARAMVHSSASSRWCTAMRTTDGSGASGSPPPPLSPSSPPRFRASRNDGYTAASNAARDSAQSSIARNSARSSSTRRTPPPASERQSLAGRRSATVPPGRASARDRSTKSAARSTCAEKPRPAAVSSAPGVHAASRNERYCARSDSRIAGGMLWRRTQGGFPAIEVEPARRRGVGEMHGKRERKRRAGPERGDPAPEVARARSQLAQGVALRRRGDRARREQVARPHGAEEVAPAHGDRVALALGHHDRRATLLPVECARERPFARAGRTRIPAAQARERRRRGDHERLVEGGTGERVAHPNVPVQVRQRRHGERIALAGVDDHGEPEAQLAQPDGGGVDVHAEDRACEHVAAAAADGSLVPGGAGEIGDSFEQVHEKRARAARGVEDAQPGRGPSATETDATGKSFRHRAPRSIASDGTASASSAASSPSPPTRSMIALGRVERAGGSAIGRGHQRLERAAEHLRIDGRLAPRRRTLARGHAIPRKQAADELAERLVREAEVAHAPLERRAREEAAVEERNASERASRRGPPAGRCVQRPEEERIEQPPVHFAAARAARVEGIAEELAVAVEPALGLEEREEEDARRAEQGELAPRPLRRATARGPRERSDHALEFAIEAPRERVAPEQLAPAMVHEHVHAGRRVRHRGERLAVRIGHVGGIDRECGDASPDARRGRGDHQRAGRGLRHDEKPEQLWSPRGHPSGHAGDGLAQRRVGGRLDQQRAQRSRPVRHRGAPDCAVEPERPARITIERQRLRESERGKKRSEIAKVSGGGKKRGGAAQGRHTPRSRSARADLSPRDCAPRRKRAPAPPQPF